MAHVERIDHRSLMLLGAVTICSYGTWYYAFGVLLDPIRLEEGWSESALAASFSAGTVLVGLTALAGGRLLDAFGHRRVFLLAAATGPVALVVASLASSMLLFFVASALALGAFGALGIYHITMATAVRLNPKHPTRAIAVLTIWGAPSSAIYLPATSALVDNLGWRATTQIHAGVAFGVFAIAALLLPPGEPPDSEPQPAARQLVAAALQRPEARLFTITVACAGVAMSAILVYQVPTMTAVGLPAGTAAAVAGLRGFSQLAGRLPLAPIVSRLGTDGALTMALVAIGVGGSLLAVSGTLPVAVLFALVAGFGIGAFSPLQGMKAEELFDRRTLGATMGLYSSVLLLAGSLGPVAVGIIADTTGERRWVSVIIVTAVLCGLIAQRKQRGRIP